MIENFFQKVLILKTIPRQGWKEKLEINHPESVADHSYAVSTSKSSSITIIPESSELDNFFLRFLAGFLSAFFDFAALDFSVFTEIQKSVEYLLLKFYCYYKKWCQGRDLNARQLGLQPSALPG